MKCMNVTQASRHLHVVEDHYALPLPLTDADLGRRVSIRGSFLLTFAVWSAAVCSLLAIADFVR